MTFPPRLCQHRWSPVAGMVGFRNAVGNEPLSNWQTGDYEQIAFGRGSSGFLVINNEDGNWSTTFSTGLPDGTYCDVCAGPKNGANCAGNTYTIVDGDFTATIPGRTAIAMHIQALATSADSIMPVQAKLRPASHGIRSSKGA